MDQTKPDTVSEQISNVLRLQVVYNSWNSDQHARPGTNSVFILHTSLSWRPRKYTGTQLCLRSTWT